MRVKTLVQVSLHHLKRVTVGPELLLWIEAIKHLPVDSDIFSSVIWRKLNCVKLHFKLDDLFEDGWREPNFNQSFLLCCFIIKEDSVLIHVLSSLENDILIELGVLVSVNVVSVFPLWLEKICSFTSLRLKFCIIFFSWS